MAHIAWRSALSDLWDADCGVSLPASCYFQHRSSNSSNNGGKRQVHCPVEQPASWKNAWAVSSKEFLLCSDLDSFPLQVKKIMAKCIWAVVIHQCWQDIYYKGIHFCNDATFWVREQCNGITEAKLAIISLLLYRYWFYYIAEIVCKLDVCYYPQNIRNLGKQPKTTVSQFADAAACRWSNI